MFFCRIFRLDVSPLHDWDVMTCIMLSVPNDLNSSAKFKPFFISGKTFLLFVLFLSLSPLKQQGENQLLQAKSVHTSKAVLGVGGEMSYTNYVFACGREKWRDIILYTGVGWGHVCYPYTKYSTECIQARVYQERMSPLLNYLDI